MAEHIQLGLKCPNCGSSLILGYDPDIDDGVPCVGCGHTLDKEEVMKQAEPHLRKLAEDKAREAFSKIPGFKPVKK